MIGEEWRDVFDNMLTRDNTPYVKPDKRSLLHFAEVGWRGGFKGGWVARRVEVGSVLLRQWLSMRALPPAALLV